MPQELAALQYRYVYQILGRAAPLRDFVVWDDDMLNFLLRLDQQLVLLPKLSDALQRSHFLVLGLSLADWLVRFFIQVVKRQRVSELAGQELYIFEKLDPAERNRVVIYFSRLTKQISVLPADPLQFIAELHQRWRQRYPAPVRDPYAMSKEHREQNRGKVVSSSATHRPIWKSRVTLSASCKKRAASSGSTRNRFNRAKHGKMSCAKQSRNVPDFS